MNERLGAFATATSTLAAEDRTPLRFAALLGRELGGVERPPR